MNLTINELQDIATDMLESVVHVCETYHLPYIAMYGSLIGAIRHHGPIPWDYDIDIAIPENSLDKFYELQDYRAKFYILAANERKSQFESLLNKSVYNGIRDFVKFVSYDALMQQYEKESIVVEGGEI